MQNKELFFFLRFFSFLLSYSSSISTIENSVTVLWCLAYENQVCIAQTVRENVTDIWNIFQNGERMVVFTGDCLEASLYGGFSRFYRTLKVDNFISVDIQT